MNKDKNLPFVLAVCQSACQANRKSWVQLPAFALRQLGLASADPPSSELKQVLKTEGRTGLSMQKKKTRVGL